MTSPTVSVILPVYNSASTLARAIDSILTQTSSDYEIIVVDDGSTDDIDRAIAPYLDRLRFIRQPNRGASAARNTACRSARGQLLAFLDADDFWHPRKLEIQLAVFASRPDIVLCWTLFRRHRSDGPPPIDAIPAVPPAEYVSSFDALFLAPYLGTPTVMLRKDRFMEVGGFREDLQSAEDVDMWLRASYQRSIAMVSIPLAYVVFKANSLTSLHRDGTFKDNLQVIEDFCESHPSYAVRSGSVVRRARSKVCEDWASSVLIKGDFDLARKLLLRSLRDRIGFRACYLLVKSLVGAYAVRVGIGHHK